jgi:tripartite ATP-independent transporter DctM subunit
MLIALLLVVLAVFGAPLFAVIAASALFGFAAADVDLSVVLIEVYRIAETPVLLSIPLFTFAGYLLGESHAPRRLVRMTNAVLGWLPGGLAVVALVACALFTAFTGATGVTIVALGALLFPALKQAGYPDRFNLGLITTSGSFGLLFAPSLPLILYGVVAQQLNIGPPIGIDQLFLAGLLPGLLMVLALGGWGFWQSRHAHLPLTPFSWREAAAAVREAIWELPLPFVVLGGIYGGKFAVSEAAAVTALYVLIVEVFVYREIRLASLPRVMRESMMMVGGILLVLGVSLASTNYLLDQEVPTKLFRIVQSYVSDPLTFLLLLNLFLLVLGMMLDIFSALVIMVPLLLPIAIGYGIHPLHLGIIFLANMQLGYLTPPVGMSLFIASYRFNRPVMEIFHASLPFLLILTVSVLAITYWPTLSLGLVQR